MRTTRRTEDTRKASLPTAGFFRGWGAPRRSFFAGSSLAWAVPSGELFDLYIGGEGGVRVTNANIVELNAEFVIRNQEKQAASKGFIAEIIMDISPSPTDTVQYRQGWGDLYCFCGSDSPFPLPNEVLPENRKSPA